MKIRKAFIVWGDIAGFDFTWGQMRDDMVIWWKREITKSNFETKGRSPAFLRWSFNMLRSKLPSHQKAGIVEFIILEAACTIIDIVEAHSGWEHGDQPYTISCLISRARYSFVFMNLVRRFCVISLSISSESSLSKSTICVIEALESLEQAIGRVR